MATLVRSPHSRRALNRDLFRCTIFHRKCRYEVDAPLDPRGEGPGGPIALRFDQHEARGSATGEFQRPNMWVADQALVRFGSDPDHKRRARDTATHVAADHEAQPAHHLPFDNVVPPGEKSSHAGGRRFVVSHNQGLGLWRTEISFRTFSKPGRCGLFIVNSWRMGWDGLQGAFAAIIGNICIKTNAPDRPNQVNAGRKE